MVERVVASTPSSRHRPLLAYRAMSRASVLLGLLASLVLASGCGLLLGFEDHEPWPSSSAASSSGTSTGAGGAACGMGSFATPLTFAQGESVPHEIAVDTDAVYWVDLGEAAGQGQVVRVDKAPPHTRTILEDSVDQVLGMAVDAAHVYTTHSAGQGHTYVFQIPKGGGAPSPVYDDSSGFGVFVAFALQGGAFALSTTQASAGGMVCLGNVASQSCMLLAAMQGPVRAVAIDAGTVYWSRNGTGEVLRRGAGMVETFVAAADGGPNEAGLSSLAVDADAVYWTNDVDGTVKRLAKTNPGGEPTVIATGEGSPRGIAVDGACVYWADYTGGTVRAAPKTGGPAFTLAMGQAPYAIAVDPSGVYAAIEGDGAILHIARQ